MAIVILDFFFILGFLIGIGGLNYIIRASLALKRNELKINGYSWTSVCPEHLIFKVNDMLDKPKKKIIENPNRPRYFYRTNIIEMNYKTYRSKLISIISFGITLLLIGIIIIYFSPFPTL